MTDEELFDPADREEMGRRFLQAVMHDVIWRSWSGVPFVWPGDDE